MQENNPAGSQPPTLSSTSEQTKEFAFGFDEPFDSIVFSRSQPLSGWIVNTSGNPICGIRAIAKNGLWRRRITRARRKRTRADVGAAFPHIPDARSSGFHVDLRLRPGRNQVAFQVQDAEKRWHTFFQITMQLMPLDFLLRAKLKNVHAYFVRRLRHSQVPAIPPAIPRALSVSATNDQSIAPKSVIIFATTKSNLFIREIGELVASGFREAGYPAEVIYDQPPALEPGDVLQIVLTPHEFYNLYLLEEMSLARARELTRNVILLSTEQPNTGWFEQNMRWTPYARATADISRLGVEAYRARQIPALHFGLGFHELLADHEPSLIRERSVDLTFLGSLTPRRDAFLARHARFFADRECHLHLVPLGYAKTETTRSYLTTAARNTLLADSKILLNLHYSDQRYFEAHRFLLGLANGCCVISETCEGYGPLVPNEHFAMVESESLIDAAEFYLNNPQEAQRIAAAGKSFVISQLRQSAACRELLRDYDQVLEDPAAVRRVEPDSAPALLPSNLRTKLGAEHGILGALRDDLRQFRKQPLARDTSAPSAPPVQKITGLRDTVIGRRTDYQERRRQQDEKRRRGEKVWTVFDNAAYANTPRPKLSVVVTLFNYAQFIEACIASVDRSEIDSSLEVIIVDDASTDESLARARKAKSLSKWNVRVVRKHFNTGLADARNLGIEFARAPFVFMLDADNLVLPGALHRLLRKMESGSYAAAYGLLCRFHDDPDRGVGLLSYYDWEPEVLVQSPYIDAMAMFRRDVLLELGGYDHAVSEIGWFGWEDYDIWLRFAQAGLPVGFVPNILCSYRQHDQSMLRTTNLFEADLVRFFSQRYRELADCYPPRERLFGVKRDLIEEVDVPERILIS